MFTLKNPLAKILLLVILILLLIIQSFVNYNKDFTVFTQASQLIFSGKTCYEVWIHVGDSGLKYFYSPLFALLLFPISSLPQGISNFIWLLLNLILAYRTLKLLAFYLPVNKFTASQINTFYALSILLSLRFFYDCFCLGQMTIFLVWASLESTKFILEKKQFKGASILALAINIKILPVAILMYWIYVKQLKAVFYTLILLGVYILIPGFVIGFEFNFALHQQWLSSLFNTSENSVIDDLGRQSFSSWVPTIFMDTPIQFGFKRNLFSLTIENVKLILMLFRAFYLILLLYCFGKPFNLIENKMNTFFNIALICLATPLIFPHQGKYSFFYLMPAYAYTAYFFVRTKKLLSKRRDNKIIYLAVIFVALSFVLNTLSSDGFIGRKWSDLCEYLNMITLGSLFLTAALIIIKPKYQNNTV
jgi:hypothetical protein